MLTFYMYKSLAQDIKTVASLSDLLIFTDF